MTQKYSFRGFWVAGFSESIEIGLSCKKNLPSRIKRLIKKYYIRIRILHSYQNYDFLSSLSDSSYHTRLFIIENALATSRVLNPSPLKNDRMTSCQSNM